jgi:hypothetical protein
MTQIWSNFHMLHPDLVQHEQCLLVCLPRGRIIELMKLDTLKAFRFLRVSSVVRSGAKSPQATYTKLGRTAGASVY